MYGTPSFRDTQETNSSWGIRTTKCPSYKDVPSSWMEYVDVFNDGTPKNECWFRYCRNADNQDIDRERCSTLNPVYNGCYRNNTLEINNRIASEYTECHNRSGSNDNKGEEESMVGEAGDNEIDNFETPKTQDMVVGGKTFKLLYQALPSQLNVSEDGRTITTIITSKSIDGSGNNQDRWRNELSLLEAAGKVNSIKYDLRIDSDGDYEGKIINCFQVKPKSSRYAQVALGLKKGELAVKSGGAVSRSIDVKANKTNSIRIVLKDPSDGDSQVFVNDTMVESFTNKTNANLKFGLESSDAPANPVTSYITNLEIK